MKKINYVIGILLLTLSVQAQIETIEIPPEEIEFYQQLNEMPFEYVSTTISYGSINQDNVQEATLEYRFKLDAFMSLNVFVKFSYKDGKFVDLKNVTSTLDGFTFGFQWKQIDKGYHKENEDTRLVWYMYGNLSLSIGPGGWGTITESSRNFGGTIDITHLTGGTVPEETITGVQHY